MKRCHRWILAIFLLSLVPLEVLPYSPGETIAIRSEGGSQIEGGNATAARENAVRNASRKAIKSHIGELVNLSKSESDRLLTEIEADLDDYVAEYVVNKETVQNDVVRIILDIQLIPEKLVERILDSGFIAAFRHKPRVLIALPSGQKALTTALKGGFIDLGFHVIDGARRGRELSSALESGNTDAVIEIGKELRSDVVITGEAETVDMESSSLGKFKSWRIEAALEAIRCDDTQVLAAGNFEGVMPSLSRLTGTRKAAEKLAQDVIRDFPRDIIRTWATEVATGETTLKPLPNASSPPQITISSPADGEVTAESTIRLVGAIEDDQGVGEAKLFINGASLALDKDLHLTSETNELLINRLVPLKPGENVISVLVFDQDENKVEKELKVFSDPLRREEPEKDSALQILIYSPIDGEIADSAFIPVKGEIMTRDPLSLVNILIDEKELPAKFDRAASTETQRVYRIHRLIALTQDRNVIKIAAQTISGAKSERYITVFAKRVQRPTNPEIFIYEPEDHLITTSTAVPLNSEIIADGEVSGFIVLNNGKEVIKRDELPLASDATPGQAGSIWYSPYKLFELKESLELEEGENQIEISLSLEQGESAKRNITVNRIQAGELPVRIEIESPLPGQKVSNENVSVIGEVISSVPIQEQIDITVNGKEPAVSRGMRLARLSPKKADKLSTQINRQISLTPGENEIEIVVKTETDQPFKKSISVSYVPNRDFQFGQILFGQMEDAGRKYAVIVGVSKYQDPDIISLRFASADAESVYQFVTHPEGGGFPKENVRLLTDEQATREGIMNTIGIWLPSQVKPDDMVLLFYAGHGGVEPDLTGEEVDGNSKYIIPYDANLGSLFSTAILNSMMTTMLERIHSNQMVFLIDCCYSGGSTSGLGDVRSVSPAGTKVETDVYNDFSGSGRVIISASLPNQLSFELPEWNHGLFTYNLLEGVSGEADFNQDGFVTLISEIYPFVIREVSSIARSHGFQQNPMLKCQITGDLVLSRTVKITK